MGCVGGCAHLELVAGNGLVLLGRCLPSDLNRFLVDGSGEAWRQLGGVRLPRAGGLYLLFLDQPRLERPLAVPRLAATQSDAAQSVGVALDHLVRVRVRVGVGVRVWVWVRVWVRVRVRVKGRGRVRARARARARARRYVLGVSSEELGLGLGLGVRGWG